MSLPIPKTLLFYTPVYHNSSAPQHCLPPEPHLVLGEREREREDEEEDRTWGREEEEKWRRRRRNACECQAVNTVIYILF